MLVEVSESLTWMIDGQLVEMRAGTQLEVLPWTEYEKGQRDRVDGFLAAEWLGGRRWVPATALKATDPAGAQVVKAARAAGRRQAEKHMEQP